MMIINTRSERNRIEDDEIDCETPSDFVGRLREIERNKWRVGDWKSTKEDWELHIDENPVVLECKTYYGVRSSFSVEWMGRNVRGQSDPLEGYADLTKVLGSNYAAITELGYIVNSLPNDTGARVVSVVAKIANHIWSEMDDRAETEETVLTSFHGRVEKINEGLAYVKFVDPNGGVSYAQIEAAELAKQGISEGGRFLCEIKARGRETTMTINPMPKEKLTAAEYAEIDRELEEALPDSLFDSDEK